MAVTMQAEARSLGLDAADNSVLLRLYWKAVDEGLPALPPGADRHPERTYAFQCPECGEWETDATTVAAAVAAADQYVERLTAALLGHHDATS